MQQDPHANSPVYSTGTPIEQAKAAVIAIHGRGATAEGILDLADAFGVDGVAYVAPQAASYTWYPNRFILPRATNEPYLTSALKRVGAVVADLEARGVPAEKIVLIGFSQGACLASEFVAQNPRRYGGLAAYSGGLIGDTLPEYPQKSLEGTPVFLGCSDVDFHIPVERVHESAAIFEQQGAAVIKRIYPNMGHTINQDEIDAVREIIRAAVQG